MDKKKLYYIFMASLIGIIIVFLMINSITHLINIINYNDLEYGVSKGFYITVMILEIVVIGLFSFIEYLIIKLLRRIDR